jgi:hypothetical protein
MRQLVDPERYAELIRLVRAGDHEAAAELVRLYEAEARLGQLHSKVCPQTRRF